MKVNRTKQLERIRAKFEQLSDKNKARVRLLFPASCNGLDGNAIYFPSVGRNAGLLEGFIFRLLDEQEEI